MVDRRHVVHAVGREPTRRRRTSGSTALARRSAEMARRRARGTRGPGRASLRPCPRRRAGAWWASSRSPATRAARPSRPSRSACDLARDRAPDAHDPRARLDPRSRVLPADVPVALIALASFDARPGAGMWTPRRRPRDGPRRPCPHPADHARSSAPARLHPALAGLRGAGRRRGQARRARPRSPRPDAGRRNGRPATSSATRTPPACQSARRSPPSTPDRGPGRAFKARPKVPRKRTEAPPPATGSRPAPTSSPQASSSAGETHLPCARSHALIEAGHRALCARTTGISQRLRAARRDLALQAALARLDRFDLVILDDLPHARNDQAVTSVPLGLIACRWETCGPAVAANPPSAPGTASSPNPPSPSSTGSSATRPSLRWKLTAPAASSLAPPGQGRRRADNARRQPRRSHPGRRSPLTAVSNPAIEVGPSQEARRPTAWIAPRSVSRPASQA